jgi:hypothetical protein
MQVANTILSQWGPALLVCLTVIIGLFYQNTRMNDMKDAFNRRFDDMDKRFDDMKSSFNKRFDDLKDLMKSEFRRVDERIDRLESPLARK